MLPKILSLLLGACWAQSLEDDYHEYLEPTARQGLRRTMLEQDGTKIRLSLEERGTVVRAFYVGGEDENLDELDVSSPELQSQLVEAERHAHGVHAWRGPDEDIFSARQKLWRIGQNSAPLCPIPLENHVEEAVQTLYDGAFHASDTKHMLRTGKVLQLGDLQASTDADVIRVLLRSQKLQGLVAAGRLPDGGSEHGWIQGPQYEDVEQSIEGGRRLFNEIRLQWEVVDVVRLDQDLPCGCSLLRGLLASGLQAGMIVTFLNSQFPPPFKFVNMAPQGQPTALHGCSLSYMLDLVRKYNFHLARLSGPYAAFVHQSRLTSALGPHDPDEFACYRDVKVWGFSQAFPLNFVQEWFFGTQAVEDLWRHCLSNVTTISQMGRARVQVGDTSDFQLYF